MKKVLFFMHMPPPIHGVTMCNKMIADSDLISEEFSTRILPIRYGKTIADMQGGNAKKIVFMIGYLFRLMYELIFHRPSVVYFTISPLGGAFIRDALFAFLIKMLNIKVIYHLHGKGISDRKGFVKYIYRLVFNNSYVICLSNILSGDVEEYSFKKMYVCANGVSPDIVTMDEECSSGVELLFFSNLLPAKGINEFLQLAKDILPNYNDVRFNVAGQYNNKFTKSDVEDFYNSNPTLRDKVVFNGPIYGDDKWKYLKSKDVLIHPTKNDAFPLVILEAMASSCAVIANDQGGIPDVISNEFGCLVSTGDYEALLAATREILDDRARLKDMKKNAYKAFEDNYAKSKFESRIKSIISDVCGKS